MVQNWTDEWGRTELTDGATVLMNGAELYWQTVQNSTDEWRSCTDGWCNAVLLLLEPSSSKIDPSGIEKELL